MINNLYIHIPFCIRKCMYCDFLSIPFDESLASRYIEAIGTEFGLRHGLAGEFKTIYIGGGTPTTLAPDELIRLFAKLGEVFTISSDAEITIEANPGTIDREKISALSGCGVNRFSIGVQSFNDTELKLLDRIHSASDGIRAVEMLKECGAENLSIDLIYGIPGQTLSDWVRTVSKTIGLSPKHISAYELTPEKGTPLYRDIMENRLKKPDEDAIIGMYYHAIDMLSDAGYKHYEISNFANGGFACRHNLNYWERGQYIGIGAGAHSFIGDRRIRNTNDIRRYIDTLNSGNLAIDEETEISCEDAIKEFIFLGLRKTEGLSITEFKKNLAIDLMEASDSLIDAGFLISDGNYLKLTREGIVISNSVITELMGKLNLW